MDARSVIFNLASNVSKIERITVIGVILTLQGFILRYEQFWTEV